MAPEEHDLPIPALSIAGSPSIPEHSLHYSQWGNTDAKHTVLCMHGLTRNGRDFDVLAEALAAKGYRIIAPDMPGRGKSPPLKNPLAYNFGTYAYDISCLLNALGLKTVHWIGTSMGGIIAMTFASLQPGRIASLVLNDVGCELPAAALQRIATSFTQPAPTDRAGLEQWLRKTGWATFDIPDQYWNHLLTHHLREENGRWRLAFDPNIITPLIPANGSSPDPTSIPATDLRPACAALALTPTLLIRGAQSDLLPESVAEATRALWDPSTLFETHVVPNSGHAPMLMYERDIARISEWLNKQTGNNG